MPKHTNEPQRPRMTIAQAAAWVNPVNGDEVEDVKVRKAAAADAEVIYENLKEMRDEQVQKRPDIVNKDEDILSLEEIAAAIDDASKLIFVAENVSGKVVGQIMCELEQSGEADDENSEEEPEEEKPAADKLIVANLFVQDVVRRQRIGTELYQEACVEAKKIGCTDVELSCWSFDKEGMSFFEKQGYKPLLVTMEKKLR